MTGLSEPAYQALAILRAIRPAGLTITQLHRSLGVNMTRTRGTLKTLVERGHVTKKGRPAVYALTHTGKLAHCTSHAARKLRAQNSR